MNLTLRPMTTADMGAVLKLERELFGEEAWSRAMLAGELAQQPKSRHYLVADDGGVVAGYAGLLTAGTQGDVLTLAVAGDRWGRGTGSALLAALLAEAARRGCTEVFLEVRTDNARAQQLYRRYGFTQIGIRRGYYQPSGTDALVMRKDLGQDREDVQPGGGDVRPGGWDVRPGGEDVRSGDGDLRPASEDVKSGGWDVRPGGEDVRSGDGDLRPASEDVKSGSGDVRPGGRDVRDVRPASGNARPGGSR
jgi:ribosomal-protein-alanine N-acetyltransferase